MWHQVRLLHEGQRIQWLCLRIGSQTLPVTNRIDRSVRLIRVRASQPEQRTTTVPTWRGPVE